MSYSVNNMGASATTASIDRTSGPTLYQTERCGGTFPYQFNVPNGRYAVTLMFVDVYLTQTGRRVFNVVVNGQNALTTFDIIQDAGATAAIDQTFNVFGYGSQAKIQFTTVLGNARSALSRSNDLDSAAGNNILTAGSALWIRCSTHPLQLL